MHHDEIYLIDLWRLLTRQWRGFAVALLAVVALAVAYAFLAKPRYEATAWVQVGQVGTAPAGQDPRPEPFQRVLDRLQTRSFQDEVTQSAGLAANSPEAGGYRASLKAEPSFYAGLIKLSVRAASPEQAKRLVLATVERLQAIHGQLLAEPLAQAHARLDEVQADLRAATAERDGLQQAAGKDGVAGQGNAVAAGLLLANKDTEVRELRNARSDLAARMSANYTFATSMPWPIYQPDHPVAPNRVLILGVGLLGGLGLGLFVAVALDARRRAAQPMRG
ncbi:chain-length determining protein [Dyella sp. LX-66]|uniref:Wzz/FepE/Etk N-terminal domain-containing protein n=1 Tax=unclassified Dyella TaxID=2634549 RepID=UPI001BE0E3BB|nr:MULTISPECIES: Wzz/FepE/Etk N-terminal domain-containing protein [unclassified Dyella]MBT2118308.1 chain-length determining protein [Dyella sp. LX-1]MBT2140191.1 chain-length determining protein [Dyella sp. LX-66]